jgi:ATP-dependent Clp endopeptidase proteolytic subunit ClpP
VKRWYEFRAQAKGAAEIVIYDEIGAFGIQAKAFLDELKALGSVAELTVRINSPGGSVFDGVAIYNALKRHQASITVWIDGIAASIASMIAMAGDEVVMPENAMLVLHDPSGLVAGTASDMRAMAEALDKMSAAMVAAYRDKSGAGDEEIAALMAAETWLSAKEALELGLADRVEQPVKMAAHFDLSRFRNAPPQLAAILTSSTSKEDEMSDPHKTRPRKADADQPSTVEAPAAAENAKPDAVEPDPAEARGVKPDQAARPEAVPERAPTLKTAAAASQPAVADPAAVIRHQATSAAPVAAEQPTAQVIDLDAVRADERRATLAYVSEVHELCAIAGRGDLAAGFVAKVTPVAQVRRALLEARAAEDEATAIRSQVRPAVTEPAQPAIDTAAIYAARNQNVR